MSKTKLFVIKIGGNVINEPSKLIAFLNDFAMIDGPKILVHGGGRLLDDMAAKLNVPQKMQEGRRITDAKTLDLAVMTYAGVINKNIVSCLQARTCMALGLTGADLRSITFTKRPDKGINYGYVGDLDEHSVNKQMIAKILQQGITPVFCSITMDHAGQLLNTNADTISSALSIALSSYYDVNLHYCFDKPGVLRDENDTSSVLTVLNKKSYEQLLRDKIIARGMIPKLEMAFAALTAGVSEVYIQHAETIGKVQDVKIQPGTKILLS